MSAFLDKLLHFAVGVSVGMGFWYLLERYARPASRVINPIVFIIFLIWGASGLFLFRKLGIPLLSHQLFYMAFPDWDIPIYNATRLRFLLHRSWLFHSVLIPMGFGGVWFWFRQKRELNRIQNFALDLLRDSAIGLSVGISAHLIWDALLSSMKRGFYIQGFDSFTSFLWLSINIALGLGVPLLVARYILNSDHYLTSGR